jgi:predicted ribonuclease toxin of YeeF-YezG toxin-antitoxin module
VRNGYSYELDTANRTRRVTGTLVIKPTQQRSRAAQAGAGGSDRLPTDDGGHYIARRFNGPTDAFNHFAQNANFNRGGYRVLEDKWAKDIKEGKKVYVTITPSYDGASKRPNTITVLYTVDGVRNVRPFANNSKGVSHGK